MPSSPDAQACLSNARMTTALSRSPASSYRSPARVPVRGLDLERPALALGPGAAAASAPAAQQLPAPSSPVPLARVRPARPAHPAVRPLLRQRLVQLARPSWEQVQEWGWAV
jgi:hypothetical protein